MTTPYLCAEQHAMNIDIRASSALLKYRDRFRKVKSSAEHETRNEDGFTLTELIIVIVILGVLAAVVLGHFDTSSAKGKALFLGMASVAHDASHFGVSLGTYPTTYSALTNIADSGDNTAQLNLANTWNGPYAKPANMNAAGDLVLNQVATGVTLTFAPVTPGANGLPNGLPYQYAVVASNVPPAIANAAVNLCNGQSGNTSGANGGVCSLTKGATDTVYYVFAQNQYAPY
jgi:prepilin-type N-terminal cleavage/methylation domain-containing protein